MITLKNLKYEKAETKMNVKNRNFSDANKFEIDVLCRNV